ncbi:hypothetical protein F441_10948 [Phytophthora nicotianae CJ01A1]|uniref:Uncharacterized protein n=1 Tax=Phytophthora nicotianae CJ01A1 TaxID=1317063 RepID=W2WUT5_PHYNI|nr:hypothetical protein F441_10948 [Phytophthora nicotianae CJ01A1]
MTGTNKAFAYVWRQTIQNNTTKIQNYPTNILLNSTKLYINPTNRLILHQFIANSSQSLLLKRIKASNFWVRQFIKRYKQPASGATHQENNSANSRKCAHQDNEFPKFLFSASKESPGVDDPSASVTSTSDKKRTRKISSQSPQNDHDNDAGGRDNIASRNLGREKELRQFLYILFKVITEAMGVGVTA